MTACSSWCDVSRTRCCAEPRPYQTRPSWPGLTRPSILFEGVSQEGWMRGSSPRMTRIVFRDGPGSAAHHAVKNGALRCVRGTSGRDRLRRIDLVAQHELLDLAGRRF